MIYLDNAATTKPSDEFLDAYNWASKNQYYNASATYNMGIKSKSLISDVKKAICKMINAPYSDNIIFTGSATEANNLAVQGAYKSNWKKAFISSGEHPSVYNLKQWLESKGVVVITIPLLPNGQIDYEFLDKNLDENVNFISTMIVNNETGAINNIKAIYDLKNRKCPNALLHCDGVQAFGKINIKQPYFDMFTLSTHKIGGSKGLGALYVKNIKLLKPILFGGGQEFGIRSGTENVASIYAFGELIKRIDIEEEYKKITILKQTLIKQLKDNHTDFICNSDDDCSPYIVSLTFPKVNGETLARMLEEHGVIVSTGSACSSKKRGNRVLSSMGINDKNVVSSIRVSFFHYNTLDEVIEASNIISNTYENLKQRMGIV